MSDIIPQQIPLFPDRVCTKCHQALPEDAFYVKDKRTGRRFSWCKDCHNAQARAKYASDEATRERYSAQATAWAKAHPEKVREARRQSYARNREEELERARAYKSSPEGQAKRKAYREANAEKIKAQNAEYRQRRKAEIDAYNASYREAHREEMAAAARLSRAKKPEYYSDLSRAWKALHPQERISHTHARRARLRGTPGNVTAFEWERIKAEHDWKCAWCGKQEQTDGLMGDGLIVVAGGHKTVTLCRDHIIPLRPGLNIAANLQPLCRSCNSVKHRRLLRRRP